MDALKEISHKESIEKIIRAKKVIFYCGSAVSMFPPTNLPLGGDLISSLMSSLKIQKKDFDLESLDTEIIRTLPLETIIDRIKEHIPETNYKQYLEKIITCFKNTEPNNLHYILSSFLLFKKETYIVTTNYDNAFENAVELINKDCLNVNKIDLFGYRDILTLNKIDRNSIIKIHGCATKDILKDVIITTTQEAPGFPEQFINILSSLFDGGLVVFMGYSLSEPDCLEALMRLKNYEIIWYDRDFQKISSSQSKQWSLFRNSHKAFYVNELKPFIEDNSIITELPIPISINIEKYNQMKSKFENQLTKRKELLLLMENISTVSDKISYYSILILNFLQLKLLTVAKNLIYKYKTLPGYSEFNYYYWIASCERDESKWDAASELFTKAKELVNATFVERISAQIEFLGMNILLSSESDAKLNDIHSELIKTEEEILRTIRNNSDEIYLQKLKSLLLRTKKNIIQNASYLKKVSENDVCKTIAMSEDVITLSTEVGDTTRIEVKRLQARLFYRLFKITKNETDLEEALKITDLVIRLSGLLQGRMGIINAKRQFVLYLMEAKRLREAESEIKDLLEIIQYYPDNMSFSKTIIVRWFLYWKSIRLWHKVITTLYPTFKALLYYRKDKNKIQNLILSIKWIYSHRKGRIG